MKRKQDYHVKSQSHEQKNLLKSTKAKQNKNIKQPEHIKNKWYQLQKHTNGTKYPIFVRAARKNKNKNSHASYEWGLWITERSTIKQGKVLPVCIL